MRLLLTVCLWSIACLTVADEGQVTGKESRVYIVGVVPQFDARQIYHTWRPLLDQLEQHTGLRFSLRGSASIPAFEQEFISGQFDFAYMNPYHVLLSNGLYQPLIRDDGRKLQGVIVVAKNSPIDTLADLNGQIVAFPSPNALGATLLVRSELYDKYKINLLTKYTQTHSSVYLNVILGRVVGGGGVATTLEQQPASIRERLNIIYRTKTYPSHPFSAHKNIPQHIQHRVAEAFIKLSKSAKGRMLLSRVPLKKPVKSSIKDYQDLGAMRLERFSNDKQP